MKFLKPSRRKLLLAILLCVLIVFFFVPFVFQYCQPIQAGFGGWGCGPDALQRTYFTLFQILMQGLPQESVSAKYAFFNESIIFVFFSGILSYLVSCILVAATSKPRRKRK